MSSNSYKENLVKPVLEASVSKVWEIAVQEWDVFECDEDETAETSCVCGKEGIRYLFEIRNRINGNTMYPIGSRCIRRFGNKDLSSQVGVYEKMFKLYDAIKAGVHIELNSRYFTKKLLVYLLDQGAFPATQYNGQDGENDYRFMLDMFNKRDKSAITSSQQRKISAIIAYSLKPFLARRLNARHNSKVSN